MIKQGTTAWVNFYVATVDGIAASDVVGHITPYIRQQDVNNSVVSNTVVANITSVGNDAPGWYHFSYYFSSSGNVFITFSVNNPPSRYLVMPWEEYVIPMNVNVDTNAIASGVWGYGNASSRTVGGIPTTSAIAASVWTYSTQGNPSSDRSLTYYPAVPNDYAKPGDAMALTATAVTSVQAGLAKTTDIPTVPTDYAKPGDTMALTAAAVTAVQTGLAKTTDIPTVPTAGDIATSVWGYTIGNPAASASTYLGSIGNIPQATWNYSWGTTVTSASVYLNSIYNNTSNITIPTPPTAGDIASSVWNYTDGTRGLTTSFYGTGTTSRFAVKDDIVATPGGITAADVWNYSIGNTSAISFIQGISTNTNSISLNTGSIATSYATIAGSIGTNTTDITSIKTSIGSIDTSIGSINTALGTIGGDITAVTNSVTYNNAALLNWNLSTASILALHVDNTTTTYSITRDLAGNITGVSPNN